MHDKHDILLVVQQASLRPHLRTVILVNEVDSSWAHACFSYPYDQDESIAVVKQLFDSSFEKIKTNHRTVYCPTELPILQALGRFKITTVTKHNNGSISIRDANPPCGDGYIAMRN